jgi:glycosyltransferase involved in cell wall biosynthesis
VIADDGSTPETADLVHSFKSTSPFPIQQVWQSDKGFQAARIRNKAIEVASGSYIIFIDGDCVPRPDFIAQHRRLAQAGYFVSGNRILLSASYTKDFLREAPSIVCWSLWDYAMLRLQGKINRCLPALSLPLGFLRRLRPARWSGAKTCNLAVWKADLISVNGFDESYSGWGYEDSDLILRLIHQHIKNKSGRFATAVLHLWHPESNRVREPLNLERLEAVKSSRVTLAQKGLKELSCSN